MKGHIKLFATGMAAVLTMGMLTGCTSEEQKKAAAKYQKEAENYAAGNNYEAAQKSMEKALDQTPKDEDLKKAAEKLEKEAKEKSSYTKTMEAAIAAIEADDATALNELQESDAGKALADMIGNEGSYIYIPEGGTSGKGIGYYSFADCDCNEWYYGDYKDGVREGTGIWYYVNPDMEDGSLYKEVYNGAWSGDKPNGTGHQYVAQGDNVQTDQDFNVKDGLFEGTYQINSTLEDGTTVSGSYTLVDGKYQTISDEELIANSFAVPTDPHLAIAFLYDGTGAIRSCTMIYAQDVTEGAAHFR